MKGDVNNVQEVPEELHLESDPLTVDSDNTQDGVKILSDDERIVIIEEVPEQLIYKVSDNPPPHLCFLFGMQQLLSSISSSMSMSLIVAELVCARDDDMIKTQILSTTMFVSGVATFLVTTFGLRLPIYQGPSVIYVAPLLAMASMEEFRCPNYVDDLGTLQNSTMVNMSLSVSRQLSYDRIQGITGALMAAGTIHILIGFSGLVGVFARYVGPITIVPTMTLVGVTLYKVANKFCEKHWGVTATTFGIGFILAIYLNGKKSPLPAYDKKRGFYIKWYPLHQVFSLLIAIFAGWLLSAILTAAGALSEDISHKHHYVRTDSRNDVIFNSPWFYFPYPGQFGGVQFSIAAFITCFMATVLSVIDSIGDYNAAARVCRVPPPPEHAVNRAVFCEGLMVLLGGATGACHATVSYGGNIGSMGITRVVSRRTFQMTAILYICFSLLLKISAVFITVPYPVLGGTMLLSFGIFIGLILSNLQFINLNSTRNLAIIGVSFLLGLIIPFWTETNRHIISTGITHLDNILLTLMSNGPFVGGAIAFFFDNTVRGSRKDRGLDITDEDDITNEDAFVEGREVYSPLVPNFIKKTKIYKLLPIFPKDKDV